MTVNPRFENLGLTERRKPVGLLERFTEGDWGSGGCGCAWVFDFHRRDQRSHKATAWQAVGAPFWLSCEGLVEVEDLGGDDGPGGVFGGVCQVGFCVANVEEFFGLFGVFRVRFEEVVEGGGDKLFFFFVEGA